MATEVGSLTLKVDTTGVKKGKADLDKFSQSAAAVEEAIEDVEEAARSAAPPLAQLPELANDAIPPGLPDAANDSGNRLGDMGRKAGMAGVQFEQLAGQIAAGQNPMRAIGVQAADLGFVLGAPRCSGRYWCSGRQCIDPLLWVPRNQPTISRNPSQISAKSCPRIKLLAR